MNKYIRILIDPQFRFSIMSANGFYRHMSDANFLKKRYSLAFGKELDLDNPVTFNEKLQWLKLYNRKPEYTTMVDKYEVKKYVSDIIGEEYVIPTLGVWDKFEDIDFNSLPNQFVLKCTHNSGGIVICKDKSKLDVATVKKKINKRLKRNYYWSSREWPYKDVKPRIIAEEYVADQRNPDQPSLLVYKIMTFGGKPKIIQAIQGDKTQFETIDYFDTEWNLLNIRQNFPNSKKPLEKPVSLDIMLSFAEKMSGEQPFLRVDFYEVDGKPVFSEFTFFSDSGMAQFHPESWDLTFGNWITLPKKD